MAEVPRGPLGRSALLVHAIAVAAFIFAFAVGSTVSERERDASKIQAAFAFSGVALASYVVLFLWSMFLAVRSVTKEENAEFGTLVLFVGAIQIVFLLASVA